MNERSLTSKKKDALELFIKGLLNSSIGKEINQIILFGSLVKGKADKLSDIDLLIFANKPKKVENLASNLSYDILLEQGEAIEPHVYPTSNYTMPKSYFIKLATKTGRLIYPSK